MAIIIMNCHVSVFLNNHEFGLLSDSKQVEQKNVVFFFLNGLSFWQNGIISITSWNGGAINNDIDQALTESIIDKSMYIQVWNGISLKNQMPISIKGKKKY